MALPYRAGGPAVVFRVQTVPFHSQVSDRSADGLAPPYITTTPRTRSNAMRAIQRAPGPVVARRTQATPLYSQVSRSTAPVFDRPPNSTITLRALSKTMKASARGVGPVTTI